MNKIIKLILLWVVCFTATNVSAQRRISGTVSDDVDVIPGANVAERDKNNRIVSHTVTDMNGNFTLTIKDPENTLYITCIGLKPWSQKIGSRNVFKVTLADVSHGCEKKLKIPRMVSCQHCHGTGSKNGTAHETCPTCHGQGVETVVQNMGFMRMQSQQVCHTCGGSGKVIKEKCPHCAGKGLVRKEEVVSVNIPAGVAQGMQLIADCAKQLGKPCIITMSMGIYTDLHDGSSVVCKKVRELTEGGNKAGIAVCISSGNAASYSGTIVHTLGEADADGWQMKTLVGYTEMGATPLPYYIQPTILIYATDGSDFTADLRLVNIETGEVKYVYGNFLAIDGLDFGTMPTKQTSVSLKKDSNYPNAKGGTSVVYRSYFEDVNSYLKQGYEKYRLAIFIKGTKGQEIRIVSGDKSCSEPQFIVPTSAEVLAADHTYVAGSGTLSCNSNVCDDAVIIPMQNGVDSLNVAAAASVAFWQLR